MAYKINRYTGSAWDNLLIDTNIEISDTNGYFTGVILSDVLDELYTSSLNYEHTQGTAATSWVITHNLGQRVTHVTCTDSSYNVITPSSIVFNSTTQVTITFATSKSGHALISK